jgi:5-formyltetrahydrofolate cyclo-ligase
MTKKELRKYFIGMRKELSEQEVVLRSQLICTNFFSSVDLAGVKVIHTFLPIKKYNEPDTWHIIRHARTHYPEVRFAIPRITSFAGEMEHYYLSNEASLKTNDLGIDEPAHGSITNIEDIDLVLVPLLAFDLSGNRVGYGKGFYDRFLNQCPSNTRRIGLSLFEGVEHIEDVNEHDALLHYCITPYEVIRF